MLSLVSRSVRLARSVLKNSVSPEWARLIRPHHYLHFELIPNYRSADGRVSHNSRGFRGEEFEIDKPDNVVRVVCLGDSTTYCVGLRDEETWPSRVSAHLDGTMPNQVINAGTPAYLSSELLLAFIFKIEALDPDWLVIYPTITDAAARRCGVPTRDYGSYCRPWFERAPVRSLRDLKTFGRFGGSIAYRVRRLFAESFSRERILEAGPEVFEANIRDIVVLALSRGVRVLLVCPEVNQPASVSSHAGDPQSVAMLQNREAMIRIGDNLSVPVLDVSRPALDAAGGRLPALDYADSIHFTPAGADGFARRVAAAISARTAQPGSGEEIGRTTPSMVCN